MTAIKAWRDIEQLMNATAPIEGTLQLKVL